MGGSGGLSGGELSGSLRHLLAASAATRDAGTDALLFGSSDGGWAVGGILSQLASPRASHMADPPTTAAAMPYTHAHAHTHTHTHSHGVQTVDDSAPSRTDPNLNPAAASAAAGARAVDALRAIFASQLEGRQRHQQVQQQQQQQQRRAVSPGPFGGDSQSLHSRTGSSHRQGPHDADAGAVPTVPTAGRYSTPSAYGDIRGGAGLGPRRAPSLH